MKAALIQTRTPATHAAALAHVLPLVKDAAAQGAWFILTPEGTNILQKDREQLLPQLTALADDPVVNGLRDAAREIHRQLSQQLGDGRLAALGDLFRAERLNGITDGRGAANVCTGDDDFFELAGVGGGCFLCEGDAAQAQAQHSRAGRSNDSFHLQLLRSHGSWAESQWRSLVLPRASAAVAALSSDIADRIFPLAGHLHRWKVA